VSLLLVHVITLPFVFAGILYIVGQSNIDLFLDQTRVAGRMLADKLQSANSLSDRKSIVAILDSATLSGQVVFAEIQMQDIVIRGIVSDEIASGSFIEDLKFRQHGDNTYYLSIAVNMKTPPGLAMLRLGFDEQPIQDIIDLSQTRTLFLVIAYFFITSIIVITLSLRSVRLINELRHASRRVASGHWNEHLVVSTSISDIEDLAHDLEEMRSRLVEQSSVVKRTSQILHEQQQRLIESEAMATVGEMAPVVAHNIRNPLASIRSCAELIYEENLGRATREMGADIMSEADRLDGWLREFLIFSRSPDSDLRKSVTLSDLFRDSIENYRRSLEKKNVEVIFNTSSPSIQCYGDSASLREMFNCLISNSLDAMLKGGQITYSEQLNSRQLLDISLQDTGAGISKENLEQLYKPFHTSKINGLGMGLLLVKRIVENHGGTINICSELGVSTTIQLSLPSILVAKAKVLIIQDGSQNSNEIELYLKKFNYLVATANTETTALKDVSHFNPDIILLDQEFPDVETSEFITKLSGIKNTIRVIIISGQIMDDGMYEEDWQIIDSLANTDCVYGVLLKPLILGDIKPVIDKALGRNSPDTGGTETL